LRKLAWIALGLLVGGCNSPQAANLWVGGGAAQTSSATAAPGSADIPVFVIKTGINLDPRADATDYCGKLNSRYAQLRSAERAGDTITWRFDCIY
jgi:hypothetical protein